MIGRSIQRVAAAIAIAAAGGCAPGPRPGPGPARPASALDEARRYECRRAPSPIEVDGRLDDAAWAGAPWSDPFVDIEGSRKPAPRYETRMKMLWDDAYLYVAARMEEPHVWGVLAERDAVVWHDNDFEIFIDPDGDRRAYYEVEVNALGTIFDLFLVRTYDDGGPAVHGWDFLGMRHAVHVDGTLNDPSDTDAGWSVEFALPWTTLAEHAHRPSPPRPGDWWRLNFSRVEWRHVIDEEGYARLPDAPEDNWVWSPQGVIDLHKPEFWGHVEFVGDEGD